MDEETKTLTLMATRLDQMARAMDTIHDTQRDTLQTLTDLVQLLRETVQEMDVMRTRLQTITAAQVKLYQAQTGQPA